MEKIALMSVQGGFMVFFAGKSVLVKKIAIKLLDVQNQVTFKIEFIIEY